jgi:hypothetical protein
MLIRKFWNQLEELTGVPGSAFTYPPVKLPDGTILRTRTFITHFSSFEEMRKCCLEIKDFLSSHGFVQNEGNFLPQRQSYNLNFKLHYDFLYPADRSLPTGYRLSFGIEIVLYFEGEEVSGE